jgi:hypothetical protein
MTALETWLAYPTARQAKPVDPGTLIEALAEAGIGLLHLAGDVIAATGPAEWFTPDNRIELRRRAVALATYLGEVE